MNHYNQIVNQLTDSFKKLLKAMTCNVQTCDYANTFYSTKEQYSAD